MEPLAFRRPNSEAARTVVLLADLLTDLSGYVASAEPTNLHYVAAREVLPDFHHLGSGAFPWAADTDTQINSAVRMIGPVDEIIDARRTTNVAREATLRRIFYYLKPGGRYSVPAAAFNDAADKRAWSLFVIDCYRRGLAGKDAPNESQDALAGAVSGVQASPSHDAIVKAGDHLVKIAESKYATRIMASRSRRSSVVELASIDSPPLHASGQTYFHNTTNGITAPTRRMELPTARLRYYEGDVRMVQRCLLTVESSVAPESFRFMYAKNPRNPRLVDVEGQFATINRDWNYAWEDLPGVYYHVDCENSGHFGHLTTEVISRLWGWAAAKKQFPDLKLLFRLRFPGERVPNLELNLFEACGIPRSDIVWTPGPVRVDAMVAASPLWHNRVPFFVNPLIKETWAKLSDFLVTDTNGLPSKLFVSRKRQGINRQCKNVPEVEELFRSRGYDVIYPEEHSLAEQATRFAAAREVAGFGGSALFNLMHSTSVERIIVLSHEAYTARNEHLFGAAHGCDVHYIWSPPDVAQPPGRWTEEAYYSSWTCDLPATRAALDTILGPQQPPALRD